MLEEDIVKLKPIFGVHPGKYLTVLYAVILALILFILLFLPGIIKPGSVYLFSSAPSGARVMIDGEYQGATPCRVFVPGGSHELVIERDYFSVHNETLESGNRVFASLFAPKKVEYSAQLELTDPEGFFNHTFTAFSNWGMIDSYYENYQPEPVLSSFFKALQDTGYTNEEVMYDFLYNVMSFVHTDYLLQDFFNAVMIFEQIRGNKVEFDQDITESFTTLPFFTELAKAYDNIPFWMYSVLSDEERESGLNWFPAVQEEYSGFLRDFSNDHPAASSAVNLFGIRFVRLSGGQFLMGSDGNNFPFPAAAGDFFIMDREVTAGLYRQFISENPDWSADNLSVLISENLVNEDYLKTFDSLSDDAPVNFISWYAAEAFCSWLTGKLPASFSEYSAGLPDEIQWEWAAATEDQNTGVFTESEPGSALSVSGRFPNSSGIYDIHGNLWEWCDNWYSPAGYLISSRDPALNTLSIENYQAVEKSVRGGSWANKIDTVTVSTRGSQPPSWCTEFSGFRVILVKE